MTIPLNRKIIIFSLISLISCSFQIGCSNYQWVNNRSNANWNLESAQCEAYANGNAPNPAMQSYDYGRSFSGSGIVGSTPYFYSGTISPNYAHNMQAGLNNAANAFIAMGARQNLYEQCLRSLGWYQVKPVDTHAMQQTNNSSPYISQMKEAKAYLINKNYTQAANILEVEAEKGNGEAEGLLGMLYASGNGVEKSLTKAKELFESSATIANNY